MHRSAMSRLARAACRHNHALWQPSAARHPLQIARNTMGRRPSSANKTPGRGSGMGWRLKRWRYLLRRVSGSLARRGLHGTLARIGREWRRRPAADDSLDLLPLDTPFTAFALPTSDAPVVSVIIPVHGKLAWTLACLRSIARAGAATPFEVIVVDDASPDASAETLRKVAGLRLLGNPENLGFIGSCNAGAAQARGDCLLFLNKDRKSTRLNSSHVA